MAQIVIMPKLGQTVEESTLLKWHKKVGDSVKKGEILFEIETDKAVLEIESFFDGVLLKIIVKDGETVPVTVPVAIIGQPGEPLPALPPAAQQIKKKPETPQVPAIPSIMAGKTPPAAPAPIAAPPQAMPARRKSISPRARRLAKECAINWEPVSGSGPGGRITENDVRNYLESKKYCDLRITPAAKALAAKEGIDILSVEAEGRISVEDIERAAAEKPKEMPRIRQVIAQRLSRSFSTTPHFYVTVAVDMSDLLDLRKQLKKQSKPYSVTDFILKASSIALTEFPAVNSTTDGKTVRWHSRVHLGIAVEIKGGIVVPVIRNADLISLSELHQQTTNLILKARNGKLSSDEMAGSTFTVSNMGMLGVESFTAIINPGESAILAVASILETAVVIKDRIVPRSIMKITISSDHRIVDGAMAARFVNRIKNMLEDTKSWTNMI